MKTVGMDELCNTTHNTIAHVLLFITRTINQTHHSKESNTCPLDANVSETISCKHCKSPMTNNNATTRGKTLNKINKPANFTYINTTKTTNSHQHTMMSPVSGNGANAHVQVPRRWCLVGPPTGGKSTEMSALLSIHHFLELLHRQAAHSLGSWLGLEHARLLGERVHALAGRCGWLLLQLHVENATQLESTVLFQLASCQFHVSGHNGLCLLWLQLALLGNCAEGLGSFSSTTLHFEESSMNGSFATLGSVTHKVGIKVEIQEL